MDQKKAITLLNRQLTDIQAQADKILKGENAPETIEAFARYSTELKKFVVEKIEHQEIADQVVNIPKINYNKTKTQLWQYIIFPSWWISIYKDYQARKEVIEEVSP